METLVNNKSLGQNGNFRQKWKLSSKMETLVNKTKLWSKMKMFVKDRNSSQKWKLWLKIKALGKNEILINKKKKNGNFI